MSVKAVFFDVGETLVDETRHWSTWADWLGIPRLAFMAALGAVIERGEHHRRVFDIFVENFDFEANMAARTATGVDSRIEARDFYPDAVSVLAALKTEGYFVGIAGNQPEKTEIALASSGIAADCIASSARWGVEKPSQAFFARIAEEAGCSASEIAYVGDRLDTDVFPARKAGFHAIFLVRGPWGFIHAKSPAVREASAVIASLTELPAVLGKLP